jgi:hypothetical protein
MKMIAHKLLSDRLPFVIEPSNEADSSGLDFDPCDIAVEEAAQPELK